MHVAAHRRSRLLVIVVAALAAFAPALVAAPVALAAGTADVKVQLSSPQTGVANGPFTLVATVENQGPDAADGTSFVLELPAGSTSVQFSCTGATGGAKCPDDLTHSGQVRGTIAIFPNGGSVTIQVTGRFPVATSATSVLTATVPSDVTDQHPESNTVTQNTKVDNTATITHTQTVDASSVAVGQAATFTILYSNEGPANISGLNVSDSIGVPQGVTAEYRVSCDPASTVACPTTTNGNWLPENNQFGFRVYDTFIDLDKGARLIVNIEVRVTAVQCNSSPDSQLAGTSFFHSFTNMVTSGNNRTDANTKVVVPDTCPTADLSVVKTQDRSSVAVGEEVTYTITYENRGPADVPNLPIEDQFGSSAVGAVEYSVSCDPVANTAPCPAFADSTTRRMVETTQGNGKFYSAPVAIPAGKKLVLTSKVRVLTAPCGASSTAPMYNQTQFGTLTDIRITGTSWSTVTTTLTGIEPCPIANVEVTTTASAATAAAGDTVTYTVTYDNRGPAAVTDMPISDTLNFSLLMGAEYSTVCGPGTSAGVTCPPVANNVKRYSYAWAPGMGQLVWGSPWNSTLTLGAGQKLELVISALMKPATCPATGQQEISNKAERAQTLAGVTLTGTSSALASTVVTCNDVSSNTTISSSSPLPGSALPITSTVSNSAGTAVNVPVSVALPKDGYVFDTSQGDAVSCVVKTGTGTCPSDLALDPVTRTIRGTIASLPSGAELQFAINGRAGLIPPTGGSYTVNVTAPSSGDTKPASNDSNVTFGIANQRTTASVQMKVGGGAVPEDVTFTGTMVCQLQGSFPFSVPVKAGSDTGRIDITSTLWMHDTCTARMDALPTAPTGFGWGTAPGPQSVSDVSAPVLFAFEVAMTPPRADAVTSVTAVVNVTGNEQTTSDLVFTGSLACDVGGAFQVKVVVPAGQPSGAMLVSGGLRPGDSCRLTLDALPAAPPGHTWGKSPSNNPQTVVLMRAPSTITFDQVLTVVAVDPVPSATPTPKPGNPATGTSGTPGQMTRPVPALPSTGSAALPWQPVLFGMLLAGVLVTAIGYRRRTLGRHEIR